MSRNIYGRARIVMTTFGSFGDVHPYVALAQEMKRRGAEPVIATSEIYRRKIEDLGIEFHPVRPALPELGSAAAAELTERVVDARRGAEFLFKKLLAPAVRDAFADLSRAVRGADLLVTHPITLAGPPLAQKAGIPWVSTVLAPASLWSDEDPFVPPNAPWLHALLSFGGRPVARGFMKFMRAMTNPWLGPVYELRKELGLPRGLHPLFEGQFSPALNVALFSRTMYRPRADWPKQTVVTGFPFYDGREGAATDPELLKFLDDGPAPVVFTLGSAAVHVAGDFYRESVIAAKLLQRRAVLLVGTGANRPAWPVSPDIAVFDYAPYGDLFPRAAAVVHQGGVGTTGQALRAGCPQLVMPFNHDQPDNAARVARLGVARTIARGRYEAGGVAAELKELLGNPAYARRAAEVGWQVRAEGGAAAAVELILQRLAGRQLKEATGFERLAVA